MKAIYALFISATLFVLAACGNTEVKPEETTTTQVAAVTPNATTTLDIEGMTCEVGCKSAIEKHMNKTAGVASCEIDFENETAVVKYNDETITQDEIIAEIGTIADHAYTATPHAQEAQEAEKEVDQPSAE